MLAANSNSDTLSNAKPVPTPYLAQQSESSRPAGSLPTTPIQGIVCNHFSFPLLYHADILSPFTCRLFSNNTLLDSLPLPQGTASNVLPLSYLTYYLSHSSKFQYFKMALTLPNSHPTPHMSYGNAIWLFNKDTPRTASLYLSVDTCNLLTICTHQSCAEVHSVNTETIGFLLQSPPPTLHTHCPEDSTSIWLGTTEKCITPLQAPPDASLVPYFVKFPPLKTIGRLYFLESADSPAPRFQLELEMNARLDSDLPGPFYLIKGLSPSPLIVDMCQVHDLHHVFPTVLSLPHVIRNNSTNPLFLGDSAFSFHTVAHSYGLLESLKPDGQRFFSLAPFPIHKTDFVYWTGQYKGEGWLKTMESLQKMGMEVSKLPSSYDPRRKTTTTEQSEVSGPTQVGGHQSRNKATGLKKEEADAGVASLQKENGTEEGNTGGKGLSDGMTPYVVGAVFVVALILFIVFRRRVRRGRKEKEGESSRSEELLHNNSV